MPAMNRPGFLTKAGLRRLLTSDEVWSFGRKRSSGEHISADQEALPTVGSKDPCDSKHFSTYGQQNRPHRQASTERKLKREDGGHLHQHDSVKADSKKNESESIQVPLHKSPHHERVKPPKSSDVYSGEKLKYPGEVPWLSIKNVQCFTSGEPKQSSCGKSGLAPIVSSLSSDIEEDLPYDSENSEEREPKIQETPKALSTSDTDAILDHGPEVTDNVALNVQNNQQCQTVSLLNNNHEICFDSKKTGSNPAYTQTRETDSDKKESATYTVQALSGDMKRSEESASYDDSFSEDKSEPFSLLSEALAWSEEERDVLSEEKTEASSLSLAFAEKVSVIPESSLDCPLSSNKHCDEVPLPHYVRDMTAESTLSEILSPVDEILSYGSAELPPSVKGGGGSGSDGCSLPPPPPAFEVITWTSEEELPGPPDLIEDISITSEKVPPLPVDLSLSKRDPRSLDSQSLGGVNQDGTIDGVCNNLPPARSTPQEEDDECSEYTGYLPADVNRDSENPLFSFHIGDRVLVCNSRPGVLKYKGHTAFAAGFWAGVALDTPNGNHNGTFWGVKYFTCEKNCGVLVRAEDISHSGRGHCRELDTGAGEDSFSDEDGPNEQDGKRYFWDWERTCDSEQGKLRESQSSPGPASSAPNQTCHHDLCENDASRDTANELARGTKSSEKSPLKVDHKLLFYCGEKWDHPHDCDAAIDRLTEEIFADAIKNVQESRKRPRQRMGSKHGSKPTDTTFRRRDEGHFTLNKLVDQWYHVYPETPPQIKAKPHDPSMVYKLVDVALQKVCNQVNKNALDSCEAPSYLIDDKSRKDYREVIFQITSDILHEVCDDILETTGTFPTSSDQLVTSALSTDQIAFSSLKAAVKREIQKVLNLERTDQQMIEMLQTLCKYWYAKRDQVDYILIQELHGEEKQWIDYSADQNTVKTRLAEDIFRILLDDTISVLNHIYVSGNSE